MSSVALAKRTGMAAPTAIGGVDPAIIRELSGIYKPFAKAFKELISNAFDADADSVHVKLAEDCGSISIEDDGRGLTPFEFRNDFTRVGGSYTRVREELTEKGRPKIGSKGIGFLAVARYCSGIRVVSSTVRPHSGRLQLRLMKEIDVAELLDVRIPRELLNGRLLVTPIVVAPTGVRTKVRADGYVLKDGVLTLRRVPFRSPSAQLEINYTLACRALEFEATIDFEYLLSLENEKDLEEIQDFCTIEVRALERRDARVDQSYTRITLSGLKPFVVRELRAAQRHGYVRNVESRAGIERFLWNLSRCSPVEYDLAPAIREKFGRANLEHPKIKHIAELTFSGPGYEKTRLQRPVWGTGESAVVRPEEDLCAAVDLNADGLMVKGYILGSTEVIFPAEYRGLAIRVRNVQIGAPGFLGVENIATGANKAALSQITGEINVIHGLDAIDALNPGRESFYEENADFKRLRAYLIGEGESIGGLLQRIIRAILQRSMVTSSVDELVSRAGTRRKALTSLALAVNYFATSAEYGDRFRKVIEGKPIRAARLRDRSSVDLDVESRVPGFRLVTDLSLAGDYSIDFASRSVALNTSHDIWSWKISLLGQRYRVVPKSGTRQDPLCELDTSDQTLLLNWGHPVRQQMGETSFIKSAIAWTLAYHASAGSIDDMMAMALSLVSFD